MISDLTRESAVVCRGCGPDSATGEDIDVHPDCPVHGSDSWGAMTHTPTFVWLVLNANGQVVSVFDAEDSAKRIAAECDPTWKVESWAVRHA